MRIEENLAERIERASYIKIEMSKTDANSDRYKMLVARYDDIIKEIQEKLTKSNFEDLAKELITAYEGLISRTAVQLDKERDKYSEIMKKSRESYMVEIDKLKNENSGLQNRIIELKREKASLTKTLSDIIDKFKK